MKTLIYADPFVSIDRLKQSLVRWSLGLLRALERLHSPIASLMRSVGRVLAPIQRVIVRFLILPVYGFIVFTKIRIQRLAVPTRGFLLFLITNRYLLHVTIGGLTLIVLVTNLQTRNAHAQDIGENSILFALASGDRSDISEEPVHVTQAREHRYLGDGTIVTIPHVDFDYDTADSEVGASTIMPGTIVAEPYDATQATPAPVEEPKVPGIRTYVVKNNDTVSSIAKRFGVNVGTIVWNNNLNNQHYLQPGDELRIPPVSGMIVSVKSGDTLAKLAKKYRVNADDIASANHIGNKALAIGTPVVIPGTTPSDLEQTKTQIIAQVPAKPKPTLKPTAVEPTPTLTEPSTSDDEVIHDDTSPVTTPVTPPPPADDSNLAANRLLWPTSGHSITQYYGWQHTGVDIDGDYTSPIYAAADGVVEKAGWNAGGYGLMILIDHQNGLKTRYGHSSKLFVKPGDTVKRGQVISMMGTTGRSTGTHLHFEVYKDGKRTNPLAWIR